MQAVLISFSKTPSRQCAADASPAVWNHADTGDTGEPVPALYMGGGPDLRILLRNLPGSEASTSLYCLVNRGTCV